MDLFFPTCALSSLWFPPARPGLPALVYPLCLLVLNEKLHVAKNVSYYCAYRYIAQFSQEILQCSFGNWLIWAQKEPKEA